MHACVHTALFLNTISLGLESFIEKYICKTLSPHCLLVFTTFLNFPTIFSHLYHFHITFTHYLMMFPYLRSYNPLSLSSPISHHFLIFISFPTFIPILLSSSNFVPFCLTFPPSHHLFLLLLHYLFSFTLSIFTHSSLISPTLISLLFPSSPPSFLAFHHVCYKLIYYLRKQRCFHVYKILLKYIEAFLSYGKVGGPNIQIDRQTDTQKLWKYIFWLSYKQSWNYRKF